VSTLSTVVRISVQVNTNTIAAVTDDATRSAVLIAVRVDAFAIAVDVAGRTYTHALATDGSVAAAGILRRTTRLTNRYTNLYSILLWRCGGALDS
jgi:hypothetical protein